MIKCFVPNTFPVICKLPKIIVHGNSAHGLFFGQMGVPLAKYYSYSIKYRSICLYIMTPASNRFSNFKVKKAHWKVWSVISIWGSILVVFGICKSNPFLTILGAKCAGYRWYLPNPIPSLGLTPLSILFLLVLFQIFWQTCHFGPTIFVTSLKFIDARWDSIFLDTFGSWNHQEVKHCW